MVPFFPNQRVLSISVTIARTLRRNSRNFLFVVGFTLLSSEIFTPWAKANDVMVEGVMTISPLGNWTDIGRVRQVHLQLCASNHLWIIREAKSPGSKDYTELGTDGTNLFFLRVMQTAAERYAEKAVVEGKRPPINVATAEVQPGTIPLFEAPPHKFLMYVAYGSSPLFLRQSPGILPPVPFLPRLEFTAYKERCNATWELSTDGFRFPKQINFFEDKLPESSGAARNLSATFRVHQTTNLHGQSVPLEFECIRFARDVDSSTKKLSLTNVPMESFRFISTNISLAAVTRYIPELPGKTIIRDNRLLGSSNPVPAITFTKPRGTWTTEQELRNTLEFRRNSAANWNQIRESTPVAKPNLLATRTVFLICVVLTTIAGVLIFFRNKPS
jgi:hypothetical protein